MAGSDGFGAKQITNFGCASFALTFTLDGKTDFVRLQQASLRQQ